MPAASTTLRLLDAEVEQLKFCVPRLQSVIETRATHVLRGSVNAQKCSTGVPRRTTPQYSRTPSYNGNTDKIISDAVKEAITYKECNIDGILVENMHDIPYVRPKDLTPETTAMMTRICTEIRKVLPESIPCGIQILAGCNKEAMAVAKAVDFQFIRAEGFVFSHVADEGFTDACAGPLLRYRKQIMADDVLVFADIKKKHSSHAITSDVSLSESVKAAKLFLADGIILTGTATGDPADKSELEEVKRATDGPVLIGSGVTIDNMEDYLSSEALIIGSHFKNAGSWTNQVNRERVNDFMKKFDNLRNAEQALHK